MKRHQVTFGNSILMGIVSFVLFSPVVFSPRLSIAGTVDPHDAIERGKKVWFENTYGGEKFFSFLANHPDPAKRVVIGFENAVNTPRDQRFQAWGVVNDPDCQANPLGGPDICKDPQGSGVIGIRKFPAPGGKTMYGAACASCHAGFDPLNPPADVNHPTWQNIHPTIGNQYLDSGKIFSANLPSNDPRRIMFAAWPKGTVDTTLLFNDNIMNPGVITAFWNLKHRPTFDVSSDTNQIKAGQGGEDDLGGATAAIRVYTNIGVCFSECVAAHPGQPIDIESCKKACPDFPPQKDLDDLVAFMRSVDSPKLPSIYLTQYPKFNKGKEIFEANCASCHSMDGERIKILSNDQVNPLVSDPANATHACRALTTNWEEGHLWSQFSSNTYKKHVAEGSKGYRTMPLVGVWATAPFLHNQSIGVWASPTAPLCDRIDAYEKSMRELLTANRPPKINVTPVALGPFPAGTPLTNVFSRDPVTHKLLCDDVVENKGHYYGSTLSSDEKEALIYWLKFQ